MKYEIEYSIFGTCNRPHLWQWLYDTLSMNKTRFEIIFVGNAEPNFTLPDNFHFIYSNVKPVQCEYIASAMCSGEVMQEFADDCHLIPFGIDMLYEEYKKQNDYKCIIAPRYIATLETPNSIDDIQKICDAAPSSLHSPDLRLTYGDLNSPSVCVAGVISNQFFRELGGYDRRFIIGHADLDMQIRAQMCGGRIIYKDNIWLAERKDLCPNWRNGITKNYTTEGNIMLRNLWFDSNGNFSQKRLDEVKFFEENDAILIQSQGPRGQWD